MTTLEMSWLHYADPVVEESPNTNGAAEVDCTGVVSTAE